MVVTYRLGGLSYALFKRIATTRYACLLNIAAGSEVAPEFLQQRCRGDLLAEAVGKLLDDPALRRRQVDAQNRALERLGSGVAGDPADRAADAVLGEIARLRPDVRIAGRAE